MYNTECKKINAKWSGTAYQEGDLSKYPSFLHTVPFCVVKWRHEIFPKLGTSDVRYYFIQKK